MIEDVIAEIEGAREEARIELRILEQHGHVTAQLHVKRALSSIEGALYDVRQAKEVLST